MKKMILLVGLCASASTMGNTEKNQAMFDMMMAMAKNSQDADTAAAAKCLGTTEAKMQAIFERAMTSCFNRYKHEAFDAFTTHMEACVEPAIEKESGFSRDKIASCHSEEDKIEDEYANIEAQMDQLNEQLDKLYSSDASSADIEVLTEQLNQLEAQAAALDNAMPPNSIAGQTEELAKSLEMLAQASTQSLHLITLPIYENSKVMMHMIDGGNMMGMNKALPAATFSSTDEANKIIAFYRKSLPTFTYKDLGNGEHIFMEKMPQDFHILRNVSEYMSTPHVMIRGIVGQPPMGVTAGAKSMIEIAYREKK